MYSKLIIFVYNNTIISYSAVYRPHLESNASEGRTVVNTLYDTSLSLSENPSNIPTYDHTYSSLNELHPND